MKYRTLCLIILFLLGSAFSTFAQGPRGNSFGFGLILGDPTGATIKYWTNKENAFTASVGSSYYGQIRLGGDYLWHFDAFNSRVVKMYAGPGLVLGFGQSHGGFWWKEDHHKFYYWDDNTSIGVAGRVIFGINIIPKRSPVEIFFELGPLIGISPAFGVNLDAALGIRFYP